MEVVHFNQRQLAARWDISEATLEPWRGQVDIEAFEESCPATS